MKRRGVGATLRSLSKQKRTSERTSERTNMVTYELCRLPFHTRASTHLALMVNRALAAAAANIVTISDKNKSLARSHVVRSLCVFGNSFILLLRWRVATCWVNNYACLRCTL